MKASFLIILIVLKGFNLFSQNLTDNTNRKWKLVWSDEFNYSGQPDDKKWNYENGYIRGLERQLYTVNRPENAVVKDGYLVITGKKEKLENPNYMFKNDPKKRTAYMNKFSNLKAEDLPNNVKNKAQRFADYTSASLTTLNKASWSYGKVEVLAKVPKGKGVWPAIWLLGENRSEVGWPKCGEIDIMEYIGKKNNRVFATVHYADENTKKHVSKYGPIDLKISPNMDFHKYSVEWDDKGFKFFYDDQLYYSTPVYNSGETFKKPFYLLINLALGGKFAGPIDDIALPQKFMIDYVRIYQ